MKKTWYPVLVVLTAGILLAGCGKKEVEEAPPLQELPREESEESKAEEAAKEPPAEEGTTPFAEITVKDYGKIRIQLKPEDAPVSVQNFIDLAQSGFYDGLTFHRIISGFMIQGGDPSGDGTGGAEHTIQGEFAANGVENKISHVRGAVSMARSNDPNSASSQFFIVHEDSVFLDGNYAGFGFVTEGMEVVDKICEDARPVDDNGTIPAGEQPVMESVKIVYE